MIKQKIKFLAYYLPQFHQIPENDEWWGEGFTEWTNVKKAKPLFRGHQQPIIPGELGYYDLLKDIDIQKKQADLAKEYGIDGFIYYQYWFGGGKMLLEKPAEKMLADKSVDLPFCFCWANETWSGIWHGLTDKILIKQTYPGIEDEEKHFAYLLPFFKDERYIKIDGRPMFVIYDALDIPDIKQFIVRLRKRAVDSGYKGLYLIASNKNPDDLDYREMGFDAKMSYSFNTVFKQIKNEVRNELWNKIKNKISLYFGKEYSPIFKYSYQRLYKKVKIEKLEIDTFPVIWPNWDNTPRSGRSGVILTGASPDSYKKELKKAVNFLNHQQQENNFVVIKSWNEWAEGNYLEPDSVNGRNYLKVTKEISES